MPPNQTVVVRFGKLVAVLPASTPAFSRADLVLYRNSTKYVIDGRGASVKKLADGRLRVEWTACVGVPFTVTASLTDKPFHFSVKLFSDRGDKVTTTASHESKIFALKMLLKKITEDEDRHAGNREPSETFTRPPHFQWWRDEPFGTGATISFCAFESSNDEVVDSLLADALTMMRRRAMQRFPRTQEYLVKLLDALRGAVAESTRGCNTLSQEVCDTIRSVAANLRMLRDLLVLPCEFGRTVDRAMVFECTAGALYRLHANVRQRSGSTVGDLFAWPEQEHTASVREGRQEVDNTPPDNADVSQFESSTCVEVLEASLLALPEVGHLRAEVRRHLDPLRSALLVPRVLKLFEQLGGSYGTLLFGAIRSIFEGLVAMQKFSRTSRVIAAQCCMLLQIVQEEGVRVAILKHDGTRAALLNFYAAIDECREIIEDYNKMCRLLRFVQAESAEETLRQQGEHLSSCFNQLHNMVSLRTIGEAAKARDEAAAQLTSSDAGSIRYILQRALGEAKANLLAQQATLVAACIEEVPQSGHITLLRQRVEYLIAELDAKPTDGNEVLYAKLDKLVKATADTAQEVEHLAAQLHVDIDVLKAKTNTAKHVLQVDGQSLLQILQLQDDQLAALLRETGADEAQLRQVAATLKGANDVERVMLVVKRGRDATAAVAAALLRAQERHSDKSRVFNARELREELSTYYRSVFQHMSVTGPTMIDFGKTFRVGLLDTGAGNDEANEHPRYTPADIPVLCKRLGKGTVLIEGQLGQGKTTLCKHLARDQDALFGRHEDEQRQHVLHTDIVEQFVVIFVHLPSLRAHIEGRSDSSDQPVDASVLLRVAFPDLNGHHAQTRLTADDVDRTLNHAGDSLRVLWLLDGFDEISTSEDVRLQAFFNTFVFNNRAASRVKDIVVVTSRKERHKHLRVNQDFTSFLRLELQPWGIDTVEHFVSAYFKAHRELPDEDYSFRYAPYLVERTDTGRCPAADSVFAALRDRTLASWAGVPLLYEMLCFQALSHDGQIHQRVSLAKVLEAMLRDLMQREVRKTGAKLTDAQFSACRDIATDNAWELHISSSSSTEFTLDFTVEDSHMRDSMDLLCRSLCQFRHDWRQQGPLICTFVHRVFADYFVACRLISLLRHGRKKEARRALKFGAKSQVVINLVCHLAKEDEKVRGPAIKLLRAAFFDAYGAVEHEFKNSIEHADKQASRQSQAPLLSLELRREWIRKTNIKILVDIAIVMNDPDILNARWMPSLLGNPSYSYLLLEPAAASGSIVILKKALEFNSGRTDMCYLRQCLIMAMETSAVFGTQDLVDRLKKLTTGVPPTIIEAALVGCTAVVRQYLEKMSFRQSSKEILKCGRIAYDLDDRRTMKCVLEAAQRESPEALRSAVTRFVRRVLDTGNGNEAAIAVGRFAEIINISGPLRRPSISSHDYDDGDDNDDDVTPALSHRNRWRFDSTWDCTKTIVLHELPPHVIALSFQRMSAVERITISNCASVATLRMSGLQKLSDLTISDCPLVTTLDVSAAVAEFLLAFRVWNCNRVARAGLVQVLRSAKRVRCLQIRGCSSLEPQDLTSLVRTQWNEATELDFGDVPAVSKELLLRIVTLPHLTTVSFAGSPGVDGAILRRCGTITSLDVSRCSNINDSALADLLQAVGRTLKVLRASGCMGVSSDAWNDFLAGATALEDLDLSGTRLGSGTTHADMPRTLTKLNASRCTFPTASVLSPCSHVLRDLDLSDTDVDDGTLVPVFRDATLLVRLNISRCARVSGASISAISGCRLLNELVAQQGTAEARPRLLTDGECKALAESAITSLDISNSTSVTGEGLGRLLTSRTLCRLTARELHSVVNVGVSVGTSVSTSLEYLDLSGCRHVTPTLAVALARAPLTWLNVSGCVALDDSILRVHAPSLRLLHTLRAQGCNFSEAALIQLLNSVSNSPRLIELDLSRVSSVTTSVLRALAEGSSRKTVLRLALEDCTALTDIEALVSLSSLADVDLSGCPDLSVESVKTTLYALSRLSLRNFRLAGYPRLAELGLDAILDPAAPPQVDHEPPQGFRPVSSSGASAIPSAVLDTSMSGSPLIERRPTFSRYGTDSATESHVASQRRRSESMDAAQP
jgi:hypothetical protein